MRVLVRSSLGAGYDRAECLQNRGDAAHPNAESLAVLEKGMADRLPRDECNGRGVGSRRGRLQRRSGHPREGATCAYAWIEEEYSDGKMRENAGEYEEEVRSLMRVWSQIL